jgi:hypothetical protein
MASQPRIVRSIARLMERPCSTSGRAGLLIIIPAMLCDNRPSWNDIGVVAPHSTLPDARRGGDRAAAAKFTWDSHRADSRSRCFSR